MGAVWGGGVKGCVTKEWRRMRNRISVAKWIGTEI